MEERVGRQVLGRVVDLEALAAEAGPSVRLRIELPSTWLADRCTLDLTAPPRLLCARCDGGGCDRCGRSGALSAPADSALRRVRVELPRATSGVALRIARPFGGEAKIEQLILEVREGREPSPGVVRCGGSLARPRAARVWRGAALAALAIAAAVLISLFSR